MENLDQQQALPMQQFQERIRKAKENARIILEQQYFSEQNFIDLEFRSQSEDDLSDPFIQQNIFIFVNKNILLYNPKQQKNYKQRINRKQKQKMSNQKPQILIKNIEINKQFKNKIKIEKKIKKKKQ